MSESETTPEVVDLPLLDMTPATWRLLDIVAADPDHTPCRAGRIWTSSDPDDRRLAATFCRENCPYLALCEEAVLAEDPQGITGVWAGVDYTTKTGKDDHAIARRALDDQDEPQREEC